MLILHKVNLGQKMSQDWLGMIVKSCDPSTHDFDIEGHSWMNSFLFNGES